MTCMKKYTRSRTRNPVLSQPRVDSFKPLTDRSIDGSSNSKPDWNPNFDCQVLLETRKKMFYFPIILDLNVSNVSYVYFNKSASHLSGRTEVCFVGQTDLFCVPRDETRRSRLELNQVYQEVIPLIYIPRFI